MNEKQIVLVSVLSVMAIAVLQAEVRRPTLPRGLTVEKSLEVLPKARNEEKPRNLRYKRKGLQGIKVRYTFSDLRLNELEVTKNRLVSKKDYFVACKHLKRMLVLCDDINKKAEILIELADLLFLQQNFDDASKYYTEFTQLYPGNKQVEYASYRAVICASKNMLSPDRDQASTEKTLELAQAFLKWDHFTRYQDEVRTIERECYKRLAASDLLVAEFYITKQHDYASAKKRIDSIRNDWLNKAPEIGVELAQLEVTFAGLCDDFKAPEESIKLAQSEISTADKKVDMAARF